VLFAATAMALPAQTFTTLHSFDGTDGYFPQVALVQGIDGNLYGTVTNGGANSGGTVFKITPSGTFTTIYSFCSQSGCLDGSTPFAGLVQATNGDFYGTTGEGGANGGANCAPDGGCGTVFKITPTGTLTTLHGFCAQSGCTDGRLPVGTLVKATNGDFYGTTNQGGADDNCSDSLSCGTVFKITPNGTLTTLHSFDGTDGEWPYSGLVQATNGDFYGTTLDRDGTVFSFSVGLGPFLETRPTSGKAGRFVEMLGTNLTGATSVSFNGTAAAFTVVSQSLISTTVPAGASTGEVQVVTPGGTLSSNVPFRVLP
jgi:uncharacterized repeat protein (TIGR03803 family)